jgi:N-hydroxyarylamine O-acetyltransferase
LRTGAADRYLHLLQVRRQAPTWVALVELVAAHMTRVPFENLSKLYRHKHLGQAGLPGIDAFLDGIERFHFGGTCYANNYHLYSLLLNLGYEARLCGADMREPDVHLVIMVRLEGRDYLVDAGYGGPFMRPLPLDALADLEFSLGRDRYVLRARDQAGHSGVELHRAGRLVHGYRVKPEPRRIEEFGEVIRRSFLPEAIFLNTLVLVRFTAGRSVTIHSRSLIRCEGDRTEISPLRDQQEQVEEIERRFGIPARIATAALAELHAEEDPWAMPPAS